MFRLEESIVKKGTWLCDCDFMSFNRVVAVLHDDYIIEHYEGMTRYIGRIDSETLKHNYLLLGHSEEHIIQELNMLYDMLDEIRNKTNLIETESRFPEHSAF